VRSLVQPSISFRRLPSHQAQLSSFSIRPYDFQFSCQIEVIDVALPFVRKQSKHTNPTVSNVAHARVRAQQLRHN
jgi:hypothetical protein